MPDPDDLQRPHAATSSEEGADERLDPAGAGVEPGHSVDGAMSDDPRPDPAFEAVIEGGGGVAEGYEQSEASLVDHAEGPDARATDHILEDAAAPEEPHQGEYGEADHVRNADVEEGSGA